MLQVADLDRAERFYAEALGLPGRRALGRTVTPCWCSRNRPASAYRSRRSASRKPGGGHVHFAMQVPEEELDRSSTGCAASGHEVPMHEFGPLAAARRPNTGRLRARPRRPSGGRTGPRAWPPRRAGERRSADCRAPVRPGPLGLDLRRPANSIGASVVRAGDELDRHRHPCAVETSPHRRRRLTGEVPAVAVKGQCRPAPFRGPDRAAALPPADRGCGTRGEQCHRHVDSPEQRVHAGRHLRLRPPATSDACGGNQPAEVRRGHASAAPDAPDWASRARRHGSRGGTDTATHD